MVLNFKKWKNICKKIKSNPRMKFQHKPRKKRNLKRLRKKNRKLSIKIKLLL